MGVNLIPQDELTLGLLAQILAKMYWYALNSKNDAPAEVAEPGPGASSVDLGDRQQGHSLSEPDLTQGREGLSDHQERRYHKVRAARQRQSDCDGYATASHP